MIGALATLDGCAHDCRVGGYSADSVTPYMHALRDHVPEICGRFPVGGIKQFSCTSIERQNGTDQRLFWVRNSRRRDEQTLGMLQLSRRIFFNHTAAPANEALLCNLCNQQFVRPKRYATHVRSHLRANPASTPPMRAESAADVMRTQALLRWLPYVPFPVIPPPPPPRF